MRADQPVSAAAAPTVRSSDIGPKLTTSVSRLRLGGPLPPVGVLEPHDVVELGRRDLEDGRVLERRDAVDGAGHVAERGTGTDDLVLQHRIADVAELQL